MTGFRSFVLTAMLLTLIVCLRAQQTTGGAICSQRHRTVEETTMTTSSLCQGVVANTTYTTSASSSLVSPVTSLPASPSAVDNPAQGVTASNTSTCEGTGNACVGDVTHWGGGLGACGWNVDSSHHWQISLPYRFMGTQSNGNPYCGRSVTLHNPRSGTVIAATVGDKCMGCVDRAIDCTDVLFVAITDGQGDGRMSGIEWWFN